MPRYASAGAPAVPAARRAQPSRQGGRPRGAAASCATPCRAGLRAGRRTIKRVTLDAAAVDLQPRAVADVGANQVIWYGALHLGVAVGGGLDSGGAGAAEDTQARQGVAHLKLFSARQPGHRLATLRLPRRRADTYPGGFDLVVVLVQQRLVQRLHICHCLGCRRAGMGCVSAERVA